MPTIEERKQTASNCGDESMNVSSSDNEEHHKQEIVLHINDDEDCGSELSGGMGSIEEGGDHLASPLQPSKAPYRSIIRHMADI